MKILKIDFRRLDPIKTTNPYLDKIRGTDKVRSNRATITARTWYGKVKIIEVFRKDWDINWYNLDTGKVVFGYQDYRVRELYDAWKFKQNEQVSN